MKSLIYATIFGFLAVFAISADAQRTGSRIGKTIPRTQPELVFDAMTNCFLKKHEKFARKLLLSAPGSAEETKIMNSISGALDLCINQPDLVFLGQQLEFETNRFRRAVATGLLRKHAIQVPEILPVNDQRKYWTSERLSSFVEYDSVAIEIAQYGQCVVSKNWSMAKALVLSPNGSEAAKRASKELKQPLESCLKPDATLSIDRRLLAHLIGEGMYYQLLAIDGII